LGNGWYDCFAEAYKTSDLREQKALVKGVAAVIERDRAALVRPTALWSAFAERPDALAGRLAGWHLAGMTIRAMDVFTNPSRSLALKRQLPEVALALAMYRLDHGRYPATLEALVPKYIGAVPDDIFSDKPAPIRYRRESEAYVMWSVGINGRDDNAHSYGDDPRGDDRVLRPVPVKPSKR
jgi:hypothetical protein